MINQKPTPSINYQRDRLSYLWLALGIVLFAFVSPRWTIPLAAWLFPIFMLRFVRTQPLLRGMLLLLLAETPVLVFELQGVAPASGCSTTSVYSAVPSWASCPTSSTACSPGDWAGYLAPSCFRSR
jgi:hypothetical protein